MTTRRPRSDSYHSYEPTLVPLADMLTNTVGIIIFILVFIVLATGGANTVNPTSQTGAPATKPMEQILEKLEESFEPVLIELEAVSKQADWLLGLPSPAQERQKSTPAKGNRV